MLDILDHIVADHEAQTCHVPLQTSVEQVSDKGMPLTRRKRVGHVGTVKKDKNRTWSRHVWTLG